MTGLEKALGRDGREGILANNYEAGERAGGRGQGVLLHKHEDLDSGPSILM